jgi:hypothetical protein
MAVLLSISSGLGVMFWTRWHIWFFRGRNRVSEKMTTMIDIRNNAKYRFDLNNFSGFFRLCIADTVLPH